MLELYFGSLQAKMTATQTSHNALDAYIRSLWNLTVIIYLILIHPMTRIYL